MYFDNKMLRDEIEVRYKFHTFFYLKGEVLVSVNPYKQLDIYGQEFIRQYKGNTIYFRVDST